MPRLDETVNDVSRQLAREAERVAREAGKAAQDGLKQAKARARKQDSVGRATFRAFELAHLGVGATARALSRLEEAIAPPLRAAPPARKSVKAAKDAAKDKDA